MKRQHEPTRAWYQQLIASKDALTPLKTAIVHPVDELSLRGAVAAAEAGLIIPILVGPQEKILAVAQENQLDISSYTLIPTRHSEEAAEKAVAMVRKGEVEALMKGKIHTDELISCR